MTISRVTNRQVMNRVLTQIQSQMKKQETLFQQISSNKRVEKPSDDPASIGNIMQLRDQLLRSDEFDRILQKSGVWNQVGAGTMDSVMETWQRINELAVSAADGSKSGQDRIIMAEEADQLLQYMVNLANTTYDGQYLFAGSKIDRPPFATDIDSQTGKILHVAYQGDSEEREIRLSDTTTIKLNFVGGSAGNENVRGVFADQHQQLDVFKTLIEFRNQLLNNDSGAISGADGTIKKIDTLSRHFVQIQTHIDSIQGILNRENERFVAQKEQWNASLAQLEEGDMAQLMLELNNVQSTYEAALRSGGRIMEMSLLDFI